jgi:hypothetical protein
MWLMPPAQAPDFWSFPGLHHWSKEPILKKRKKTTLSYTAKVCFWLVVSTLLKNISQLG